MFLDFEKLQQTHLVLGDALGAVGAADILDVAPAVLVPSMVPPLRRHLLKKPSIVHTRLDWK